MMGAMMELENRSTIYMWENIGIPANSKDSIMKLAENRVLPAPLSTRLECKII